MAALTTKRMTRSDAFRTISLPLAAQAVFQGGIACYDTSAYGSVKKGASGSQTLVKIGEFAENADNTAAGSPRVLVKLDKELFGQWYDNATGAAAVTAAAIFNLAYILDDHTVTITAGTNSCAGRIWDVDAIKGVLVEKATPVATVP